jgi:hypothetical protein
LNTINGINTGIIPGIQKGNNFNTINVNQNYATNSNKKMIL